MSNARYDHSSAAVNGKLYVFGGNAETILDTVEVYDPAAAS